MDSMTVKTDVPLSRISDLLCCALEGGSNYWYEIEAIKEPPAYVFRSMPDKIFRHLDAPLNSFGHLDIVTRDRDEVNGKNSWVLNLNTIREGLKTFAVKYPSHYAEFLKENEDATTGDVFLQCCLFREVVFG